MNFIQVKNVVKRFASSSKATAALDGISLEIKSGSLFALLGYSLIYIRLREM
jgi:ABC-type multidrug transport system ATPase subunit